MRRTLLTLAAGIGVGAMAMAAVHDEGPTVKPIVEQNIVEKVDGKETRAVVVEVTLGPGQAGVPHRHPGPAFGYVLEGEYEWAINEEPARILKTGETFYEPAMALHRVSKNPSAKGKTRVLATVLAPRDAKALTIPEAKQ
jgi:quercetin dioxygenase-like cupin family protein